ncbi:TetR family transcriptional regulator [Agromyces lapidis]|uniref:TetR family transcriptional regulator n=1 Tax=Agromyces lapidis TaxID=279574 RepID=A0ABV5SU93_9MICO|nr:TetR family transcriptional regulator [Agromyces lapidis]
MTMDAPAAPGAPRAPRGRPVEVDPEALAAVALALFDERGFDEVTMAEVADAAGVSRRTLFRYYPSKPDLVWGGFDEAIARFEASLGAEGTKPSVTALHRAYVAMAEFPPELLGVTRQRLRIIDAHPAVLAHGLAKFGAVHELLEPYLGERGSLRAHLLADLYLTTGFSAMRWWARSGTGTPAEAVDAALSLLEGEFG